MEKPLYPEEARGVQAKYLDAKTDGDVTKRRIKVEMVDHH